MSRKHNEEIEVFGLAFMDLISCGLGGVIIIMLIFSSLIRLQRESNSDNPRGKELLQTASAGNLTPEEVNGAYILQIRIPKTSSRSQLDFVRNGSTMNAPEIWSNFHEGFSSHVVHYKAEEEGNYGTHRFQLRVRDSQPGQQVFLSLFSNGLFEDTLYAGTDTFDVVLQRKVRGFELTTTNQ